MQDVRGVVKVKEGLRGWSSVPKGRKGRRIARVRLWGLAAPVKDFSLILKAVGNLFPAESDRIIFEI